MEKSFKSPVRNDEDLMHDTEETLYKDQPSSSEKKTVDERDEKLLENAQAEPVRLIDLLNSSRAVSLQPRERPPHHVPRQFSAPAHIPDPHMDSSVISPPPRHPLRPLRMKHRSRSVPTISPVVGLPYPGESAAIFQGIDPAEKDEPTQAEEMQRKKVAKKSVHKHQPSSSEKQKTADEKFSVEGVRFKKSKLRVYSPNPHRYATAEKSQICFPSPNITPKYRSLRKSSSGSRPRFETPFAAVDGAPRPDEKKEWTGVTKESSHKDQTLISEKQKAIDQRFSEDHAQDELMSPSEPFHPHKHHESSTHHKSETDFPSPDIQQNVWWASPMNEAAQSSLRSRVEGPAGPEILWFHQPPSVLFPTPVSPFVVTGFPCHRSSLFPCYPAVMHPSQYRVGDPMQAHAIGIERNPAHLYKHGNYSASDSSVIGSQPSSSHLQVHSSRTQRASSCLPRSDADHTWPSLSPTPSAEETSSATLLQSKLRKKTTAAGYKMQMQTSAYRAETFPPPFPPASGATAEVNRADASDSSTRPLHSIDSEIHDNVVESQLSQDEDIDLLKDPTEIRRDALRPRGMKVEQGAFCTASSPGWTQRASSCLPRSHSWSHVSSLNPTPCADVQAFPRANSLPAMPLQSSFEEFTPDITVDEPDETYRFQCSQPGLYQCTLTGLVFHMDGDGDVVYRVIPWNRRLLGQHHKKPAGPLFDISCVQKSVRQLHLPHCEIRPTAGPESLSVAHVSDDGIEFIVPHKTTETHVIINITSFSGFGNVKDEDSPPDPVRALALLFYRPPADPNPESRLNVLLLPGNVVLRDVVRIRKKLVGDECYIETTPQCKLAPKQKYTLSTCPEDDSILVQPREAEFDNENYDNYFPSFQVDLEQILTHVELSLRDSSSSSSIWERRVRLSSSAVKRSSGQNGLNLSPKEMLQDKKSGFIGGISDPVLKSLLDRLLERKVMCDSEKESVDALQNREDKVRQVIDMVRMKGNKASSTLIEILCKLDKFLCEDLGLICS